MQGPPPGYPYPQQSLPEYRPPPPPPSYLAPPPPSAHPRRSPERDPSPSNPRPSRPKSFDADDLKARDGFVIASLYELIPQQCHTCGLRCHSSDEMSSHLDYHFKLSSREVKRSTLRLSQSIHQSYYWTEDEWVTADDVVFQSKSRMMEERVEEEEEREVEDGKGRSVQADEAQTACPVCQDEFVTEWDDEEEAWVYRGAIRVRVGGEEEEEERGGKSGKGRDTAEGEKIRTKRRAVHAEYDGRILHLTCYQSLLATAELSTKVESANAGDGDDSLPALEAVPPEEATQEQQQQSKADAAVS